MVRDIISLIDVYVYGLHEKGSDALGPFFFASIQPSG